jgi:hypothetical protein
MIDRSGVWGDQPPLVGRRLGGHPVDEGGNVRPVLLQVCLFLLQLLQQPAKNRYNSILTLYWTGGAHHYIYESVFRDPDPH